MSDLLVVLNGQLTGAITHSAGRPRFSYLDSYAEDLDATPLSLSMPPAVGRTYDHRATAPWLLNLLPDDANVRERLAHEFGVPVGSATALLEHIGRECAGAVQLAKPEDVENVLAQAGSLDAVTNLQIGQRLRALQQEPQRWTRPDERWSLAGAQPKFAATRTFEAGWAYPHGNAASTHIIKPGIARFAAQAFNEHLCLRALRTIGIAAVNTEFTKFDGVSALIVERYDRLRRSDGTVIRLHQEDMCQALSVWPERKYAADGGPSATQIAHLLAREASQRDVDRFTDAVVAQYLLGAPDAHAKNYSVILDGVEVTLAPIYDVASALPYDPEPGSDIGRVAMPIGGRAKFGEVTLHHVAKFARTAGTDPDRLTARARQMATELPDALRHAGQGVSDPMLVKLRDRLAKAVATHGGSIDGTAVR